MSLRSARCFFPSRLRRCLRSRSSRVLRALLLLLTVGILLGGGALALAEVWTWSLSHRLCEENVENAPERAVGLVLGCSPRLRHGRANYYFTGRMEAAEALWKSGKVRGLIVSGDHSSRYYNEPRAMKEDLIRRGVPPERIVCDYAGVCTYDSVARAKKIFGADSLTIISQPAHVRRAVAIARHLEMDAGGVEAPLAPPNRASTFRQCLRERGARLAMVYDFLTCRTPSHLGAPEPLPF